MSILEYIPGTRAWQQRRDRELCGATDERIQEIVDGELPVDGAAQKLLRHLEACERCGRTADGFRELKRAIARVEGVTDEALVERLRDLARRVPDEPSGGFLE